MQSLSSTIIIMWHYRIIGNAGLVIHSSLSRKGFLGYTTDSEALNLAIAIARDMDVCHTSGCIIEVFKRIKFKATSLKEKPNQ